jgi:hypothetical protein
VIVHGGGVSVVQITAGDASFELTRALLSALRDFLVEQGMNAASVNVDGREYVLSA